jgi:hypothetical protein
MKIKKQLGNDSVRALVDEATRRAEELSSEQTVRDPWSGSRRSFSSDDASLAEKQEAAPPTTDRAAPNLLR